MDLENMEMQPDLDIVNTSDLISSNKENIPSNESHAPAEPEVSEAPPGPSLPAMITIEPPSPSIVEMSDNPLHAEANSTKSESVTEAAENALAAASSTPTLTVRERVREFTSRAGGGDQPDGNSLSSSHSSIRGALQS
uniref:Uncharacterized protein n=1 Tax=Macrostomum lignano TaxID=282301 RepID=A0A1I8GQW0_9PLAT